MHFFVKAQQCIHTVFLYFRLEEAEAVEKEKAATEKAAQKANEDKKKKREKEIEDAMEEQDKVFIEKGRIKKRSKKGRSNTPLNENDSDSDGDEDDDDHNDESKSKKQNRKARRASQGKGRERVYRSLPNVGPKFLAVSIKSD